MKSGIIKKRIPILFDDQFKCLIGTEHLKTVDICTKAIYNILSNFILHQTITVDDKDPPWFNTKIKSLLQEKNKIYKNFHKDRNNA